MVIDKDKSPLLHDGAHDCADKLSGEVCIAYKVNSALKVRLSLTQTFLTVVQTELSHYIEIFACCPHST